jgi:hypothetical protein
LIEELSNLASDITTSIKDITAEEKKLQKELNSANNDVKSLKTENIKNKMSCDTVSTELIKKNDLNSKWQSLRIKIEKTENAYYSSVISQQYAQKRYYEFLKNEMYTLERIDRNRLNFMKEVLLKYHTQIKELSLLQQERCKEMKDSFSKINVNKDIQEFSISICSGDLRPPPMEFKPYEVKIPKELSESSFSVVKNTTIIQADNNTKDDTKSEDNNDKEESDKTEEAKEEIKQPAGDVVIKKVRAAYDFEGIKTK